MRFPLAAVLVAALVPGCGGDTAVARVAAAEDAPVEVRLGEPRARDVPRRLDVTGALAAREEVHVSARVEGRVQAVLADLGDRVPPGAVLLRLDPLDLTLALDQAQAALDAVLSRLELRAPPGEGFDPAGVPAVVRARLHEAHELARLRRAERLREAGSGLLSEQNYDEFANAHELAASEHHLARQEALALAAEARERAAELALARQRLEDAVLRAPEGAAEWGVAERLAGPGEEVAAGRPLFRLVDDGVLRFRFGVPERHSSRLALGQPVSLGVEAWAEPFTALVTRIAPDVRSESRTVLVEADVDNAEGRLRPGAFARGALTTHVERGVVFVPRDAIATFAGVSRVFTVHDGRAIEHRVATGVERDGEIEIVSGFAGGEPVIVSGAARLAHGVRVSVRPPA